MEYFVNTTGPQSAAECSDSACFCTPSIKFARGQGFLYVSPEAGWGGRVRRRCAEDRFMGVRSWYRTSASGRSATVGIPTLPDRGFLR